MLGVTSRTLVYPPAAMPGLSAYVTSKIAMMKMLEFLAAENPNLFVASVHPGRVDTEMHRKAWGKQETIPMDSGELISFSLLIRCSSEPEWPDFALSFLSSDESMSSKLTSSLLLATLPAHFVLWLSSPEAAFLRGKFVWANWDVDELKSVKEKIQESSLLTVGVEGWPFGQIT